MTDETRQTLEKIERRLNAQYGEARAQVLALIQSVADPLLVAHQQGMAAGLIFALHQASAIRLALGADAGAEGDGRRGGVGEKKSDTHDVADLDVG